MDASFSGKDKAAEEDSQHGDKGEKGLESEPGSLWADQCVGYHLYIAKYRGDAQDHQEDEEESSPEPAIAELSEGGFHQSDCSKPHSFTGDGYQGMVWRQISQVDCVFLVSHSKQGEYQEGGKEDPEDVTNDDDPAVTDDIVVELAVTTIS